MTRKFITGSGAAILSGNAASANQVAAACMANPLVAAKFIVEAGGDGTQAVHPVPMSAVSLTGGGGLAAPAAIT